MGRHINVDEVLEQIRKKLGIKSLDYLLEAERQIVNVIQFAPSIDIVFCHECKHWEKWRSEGGACCKALRVGFIVYRRPNDFCSSGERKEGE